MFRYKTILEEAEAEQTIERSRFIGHGRPVETKEEADAFFAEIRAKHKSATHNVPACVIGEKFEIQWASDDGEPQGTSGAPMVQMMVKEGITNVAVIVTRYFGGIKLGTGGLVRAYTGTAKLALDAAGVCQVREQDLLTVKMDYSWLGKLQNMEKTSPFQIVKIEYEDVIKAQIAMEPEETESIKALLANLTGGNFQILNLQRKLVNQRLE